jgi:hypothetical protein
VPRKNVIAVVIAERIVVAKMKDDLGGRTPIEIPKRNTFIEYAGLTARRCQTNINGALDEDGAVRFDGDFLEWLGG